LAPDIRHSPADLPTLAAISDGLGIRKNCRDDGFEIFLGHGHLLLNEV